MSTPRKTLFLKNIVNSDFSLLNAETLNLDNNAIYSSVGIDTRKTYVQLNLLSLIASLKHFLRCLQFIKRRRSSAFHIYVKDLYLHKFLSKLLSRTNTKTKICVKNSLQELKEIKVKRDLILLLDIDFIGCVSLKKFFAYNFFLLSKINASSELTHSGTYKIFNEIRELKKILFLVLLITRALKPGIVQKISQLKSEKTRVNKNLILSTTNPLLKKRPQLKEPQKSSLLFKKKKKKLIKISNNKDLVRKRAKLKVSLIGIHSEIKFCYGSGNPAAYARVKQSLKKESTVAVISQKIVLKKLLFLRAKPGRAVLRKYFMLRWSIIKKARDVQYRNFGKKKAVQFFKGKRYSRWNRFIFKFLSNTKKNFPCFAKKATSRSYYIKLRKKKIVDKKTSRKIPVISEISGSKFLNTKDSTNATSANKHKTLPATTAAVSKKIDPLNKKCA